MIGQSCFSNSRMNSYRKINTYFQKFTRTLKHSPQGAAEIFRLTRLESAVPAPTPSMLDESGMGLHHFPDCTQKGKAARLLLPACFMTQKG
jgi:hypothetical protein